MDTITFIRNPEGTLTCTCPDLLPPALVATIGVFDGVHLGHQYLIKQLREEAAKRHLPSAVVTFDIHPITVVSPEHHVEVLNSISERNKHLERTGVDYVVMLPFDKSMASLSAQDFFAEIITQQLHVKTLLMGYDHQFGRPPKVPEEAVDFIALGAEYGVEVIRQKPVFDPIDGLPYSSSRIRKLLRTGHLGKARVLLGYRYRLYGKVVNGLSMGRTLGYPTANIQPDDARRIIPPYGVYAVWVYIDSKRYGGMLYIGERPTVKESLGRTIEVNIFDFSGNIYHQDIAIELVAYTRGEACFANFEELKAALERDAQEVQAILAQDLL